MSRPRRQVAAQAAIVARLTQRCLAKKEICVARHLHERAGRGGVARVGERPLAVGDAEGIRLHAVVRDQCRRHLQPRRGRERLPCGVLGQRKCALEHRPRAEVGPEIGQLGDPTGRNPDLGVGTFLAEAEQYAPDPRHEVAPVIKVPVRDRDRIELGPTAPVLAQPAQHPGAAVEQKRPPALDEIARMGAARVRPGRAAAHDGELHSRPGRESKNCTAVYCRAEWRRGFV